MDLKTANDASTSMGETGAPKLPSALPAPTMPPTGPQSPPDELEGLMCVSGRSTGRSSLTGPSTASNTTASRLRYGCSPLLALSTHRYAVDAFTPHLFAKADNDNRPATASSVACHSSGPIFQTLPIPPLYKRETGATSGHEEDTGGNCRLASALDPTLISKWPPFNTLSLSDP